MSKEGVDIADAKPRCLVWEGRLCFSFSFSRGRRVRLPLYFYNCGKRGKSIGISLICLPFPEGKQIRKDFVRRISFPLNNKAVRKERAGFSLSLHLVSERCWQKAYPGGSSIGRQSKNYELGEVKDLTKEHLPCL